MKKKIFVILACVLVVLAAGSCNRSRKSSSNDFVIGKVALSLSVQVHQADCIWEEKFAAQDYNAKYIVLDGKADATITNDAVDNLIAQKVKGIIVNPIDTAAIAASGMAARAQGIPVITYYRSPEGVNIPWVRVYEAPDARDMGINVAKKWKEFYPDRPIKMAIIEFLTEPVAIAMRSAPFIEGVQSIDPTAEVVVSMDGNGDRQRSVAIGQDILQSHPEVNIVYGTSSDQALGVLSTFEAVGRGKAVDGKPLTEFFVGTDASQDELQKLVNPSSSFKYTMGMTPKDNARVQIDTLMKTINGELDPDKQTIIDVRGILFNYYSDTPQFMQDWFNDQYGASWDLVSEYNKMVGK
jgi:ABC-type sugar transport system substrate-binding protein